MLVVAVIACACMPFMLQYSLYVCIWHLCVQVTDWENSTVQFGMKINSKFQSFRLGAR